MSEELISLKPPRRVPAWVWLALLPAVLIGLNQVRKGGRQRVELAGSGPVSLIRSEDAPETLRYYPETVAREGILETKARIEEGLLIQPAVLVFGFDLQGWDLAEISQEELRKIYSGTHRAAENAATVPVSVGPWLPPGAAAPRREAVEALRAWWRAGPCRSAARLLCIDLTDTAQDDAAMRASLREGINHAVGRLKDLRATTQRGR